jgi:hypothetical protein
MGGTVCRVRRHSERNPYQSVMPGHPRLSATQEQIRGWLDYRELGVFPNEAKARKFLQT